MASYEKLVRDRIPEILDEKRVPYEKRIASPEEFKAELIRKLHEELEEFSEAGDPEELSDILEVIDALKQLPEYRNVLETQRIKREERGGFDQRIILKGEK